MRRMRSLTARMEPPHPASLREATLSRGVQPSTQLLRRVLINPISTTPAYNVSALLSGADVAEPAPEVRFGAIYRHDGDKPAAALNSNLMLVDYLANIGQIASHQRRGKTSNAVVQRRSWTVHRLGPEPTSPVWIQV